MTGGYLVSTRLCGLLSSCANRARRLAPSLADFDRLTLCAVVLVEGVVALRLSLRARRPSSSSWMDASDSSAAASLPSVVALGGDRERDWEFLDRRFMECIS